MNENEAQEPESLCGIANSVLTTTLLIIGTYIISDRIFKFLDSKILYANGNAKEFMLMPASSVPALSIQ